MAYTQEDANYSGVAGEDIAALDLVCLKSDGLVYKACGDLATYTPDLAPTVGFALIAKDTGEVVTYLRKGRLSGFSGLTIGTACWLSATTPGAMTQTAPAAATDLDQAVGVATAADSILIGIDTYGRVHG